MIYITDGSFEGILTAIFEAYARKEEPESIVSKGQFQMTLGADLIEIETDMDKYRRVYAAIEKKISDEAMEIIYKAYLNEHEDAGIAIYRYVKLGLKLGGKVVSYLQNPDVLRVHDMSYKVSAEAHLFLGILRFNKLKNEIYYAKMEPDNNIITILSNHFVERLSDQPWIIHDVKRSIFALYNTEQVVFSNDPITIPDVNTEDKEFPLLWKRYFQAIAIESRINPKLQKSFMPRRYWKNLIEKQNL